MNSITGRILRGRYYIVKELGKGELKFTYLAQDRTLPNYPLCIVKRLSIPINSRVSWQDAQVAFDREAQILWELGEHPQIPELIEYFTENKEFYLVEEFIDGENLEQKIEQGLLNEQSAIELIENLLEILNFLHDRDIIHGKINPANLIEREVDQKIVLINFGAIERSLLSSQDLEPDKQLGFDRLTVYMPPEQRSNAINKTSDFYALGKTIIYCLTGQSPPNNSSTIELFNSSRSTDISQKITYILNKMTRQDFTQRYSSGLDILEDLHKPEISLPLMNSIPYVRSARNNTNRGRLSSQRRKKIVLLLSIILGFVLFSGISLSLIFMIPRRFAQEQFVVYQNAEYGFKIKYPETWLKQEINDPITGEVTAFVAPKENDSDLFQESLIINIQGLSPDIRDIDLYTDDIIQTLEAAKDTTIEIDSKIKTHLSDRESRSITYSRMNGKIYLKQMEVLTFGKNQVYTVVYSAERAKYSKFLPTIQHMIKSFQIDDR